MDKQKKTLQEINSTYYHKHQEKENQRCKEYIKNNPEKRNQYNSTYYHKHQEKERQRCKEYLKNNPDKVKQYRKNAYKSNTKSKWKARGLILDNFELVWQRYINTEKCDTCNVLLEGRGRNQKCMDHDHNTGLFRNILCKACNGKIKVCKK